MKHGLYYIVNNSVTKIVFFQKRNILNLTGNIENQPCARELNRDNIKGLLNVRVKKYRPHYIYMRVWTKSGEGE